MSVIFCGDLVLPYHTDVDYSAILPLFKNHRTIVNFEGSILKDEKETTLYRWNDKFSLYSCPKVLNVLKDLNVEVVSLCNNHILDYQHDINETIDILKKYNIESWGLKNHDVWKSKLNGKPLFVITFATFSNEHSLPLFSPLKVIEEIKEIRQQNKDSYIVVFPHWGIEKFYYPEPADRSLAHRMIDAGVDLIVGHHPHVIQPIEIYKGKHIFYSLGNFISTQEKPDQLVGAILSVQLEKTTEPDGTVRCSVLSPRLLPTVTHYDAGKSNVRTYLFRDYTEALTKAHGVRKAYPDFSLEMIQSIARENIDPEFLQLT